MQLDTAIEQRKREVTNISNDINNEKGQNEQMGKGLLQGRLNLLNQQLNRSKCFYQNQKFKTMGDRYNEIATSKYHYILPLPNS